VVSWFILRGRCRHCKAPIPVRYPLVEALTALLFVGVGLKIGLKDTLVPALALTITLVAAAETDLEHRIIPNRLMATSAIAAVVLWAIVDPGRLPENLIAGAAAGGFLLMAALVYPAGMGMGDVKLAGVMGLFLGASVAPALFVGFAAGALVGIAIVLARGTSARKQGVPFGPFLAFGGIVGLLYGPAIMDWYGRFSGLGG
jgi:leader peptidase (prepilin peptidase)/N-methyltransferase